MAMVSLSLKRVVSVFILRPNKSPPPTGKQQQHPNIHHEIALFRRCATMPTFPSTWAGISGSIEADDADPLEAAVRELREETNIGDLLGRYYGDHDTGSSGLRRCIRRGLHVDVRGKRSEGAFGGRIIRVYPFALTLPSDNVSPEAVRVDSSVEASAKMDESTSLWSNLEIKGTEHDQMKFMNISAFLSMDEPCVPLLKTAFHHATSGHYLNLPGEIREWEQDRINGAANLARKAVALAAAHNSAGSANNHDGGDACGSVLSTPMSIAMLRPSMVPIVNVMKEFDCRVQRNEAAGVARDELLYSLDSEVKKCVDLGAINTLRYLHQWRSKAAHADPKFVIGTFSRSSTMKLILGRILDSLDTKVLVRVICSQSTPGEEGELMATDIANAKWMPDKLFQREIVQGKINLVLIGADCILSSEKGVVNKIGTAALAASCKQSNVPIICCADRWKLWEDNYPPCLESIFELVPWGLLDRVLVPEDTNAEPNLQ